MQLSSPSIRASSRPVADSHTKTSLWEWLSVSAAEASRLPSAENTRRLIERRVPLQRADGGTGSKVPEPDRPDLVAAGERPAVGAHGQGPHVSLVAVQRGDLTCRALPKDMPGKVTRVVLARVRNLVVQDILSAFKLAVLDRLTGQAKLRSVKMPVSQPSVAVSEVGIAVGAGGLGLEGHAVAAKPDGVLEHGRRHGDGENETRGPAPAINLRCRRVHLPARLRRLGRRARIGRSSRKRPRSSASSAAVA